MLLPETKDIQTKLGNYTRTGILPEIPGIHTGHVKHYRRLVFNVIKNNIFKAFPIAAKVIGKEQFTGMIDEFFRTHNAKTSQVWLLPGEFYEFAMANNWNTKFDMPWLTDLLLFEWIEIKVHTMPDGSRPNTQITGGILTTKLAINPDFELISLSYPVHILPVKKAASKKGVYYLLIFRNPDSGKVHFVNLSILHAILIKNLANNKETLDKILPKLAKKFNISDNFQLQSVIVSFIKDLLNQQFVLGFLQQN